jgi:teichuronic acid biosynthesis glycosyltransferase TuaH
LTPVNRHLVWMAAVSWDGIRGTDWHMARAMTRHARILWVDPPISPITPATRRAGVPRTFKPVISPVDERVTRVTPVALPGMSRPVMRVTTAPLVHAQVRWAVRRLGIMPFAVVASHLDTALGRWGDIVVNVLYGTDDYVAGARLAGLSADRLRNLEQRSLAGADVVIAVSPQLADKWAALGAEPVVIPNGCHLARGSLDGLPSAVRDLPSPVVGLVGQLSERIDLDILNGIVDAGYSLLVVGPADQRWEPQRFPALIARPRVHYAGCVPMEAVPSYLAATDIGITPYAHSPFNRASFPLKTLEYLGAGRSVVSTDLPAARLLRDDLARSSQAAFGDQILALAASPADFVAAVRRMVGDPGRPAAAESRHVPANRSLDIADHCRAFAERHSWSSRADSFAAVIGLSSSSRDCPDPSLAGRQP